MSPSPAPTGAERPLLRVVRAPRRAAIGGAGVAGLSAAILLAREGWEVDVWERRQAAGGLVQPVSFRGIPCDLGSHRLHLDATADPLIRELGERAAFVRRPRRGRIVLGGSRIPYPLTPAGLLWGLGVRRMASYARGFLEREGPFGLWEQDRADVADGDVGFERFVTSRVGRRAYDGFYRPYAEKVWGLPPAELSQAVAKKRVSTGRPLEQLARAVAAPLRPPVYLYPRGGMGGLTNALLAMAREAGVRVRLGRALDPDRADADAVLYSGHLGDLAPGAGLRHRGLYLLFLAFPVDRVSDVETWYTPERRYWFGRVSELRNYSEHLGRRGETVLCVEIPEGSLGAAQDFTSRVDAVCEQLQQAGVLRGAAAETRPLEARQHWLPDVYPLYERGYWQRWTGALEQATRGGRVVPFGRQGLFLHSNIDHSVSMARAAVEHVTRGGGPQGWIRRALEFATLQVRD